MLMIRPLVSEPAILDARGGCWPEPTGAPSGHMRARVCAGLGGWPSRHVAVQGRGRSVSGCWSRAGVPAPKGPINQRARPAGREPGRLARRRNSSGHAYARVRNAPGPYARRRLMRMRARVASGTPPRRTGMLTSYPSHVRPRRPAAGPAPDLGLAFCAPGAHLQSCI